MGREKGTLSSIRLKLELKNSVVLKKIGFFFNLHSDDFREDTEASVLKKKLNKRKKSHLLVTSFTHVNQADIFKLQTKNKLLRNEGTSKEYPE